MSLSFEEKALLDIYAGHALTGILANPNNEMDAAQSARFAWDCAVAMMMKRDVTLADEGEPVPVAKPGIVNLPPKDKAE